MTVVGLVHAELALHRGRGQADLVPLDLRSPVQPAAYLEQLDLVGVPDGEPGELRVSGSTGSRLAYASSNSSAISSCSC